MERKLTKEQAASVALRKQIKENIRNCRKEIYRLEKQCKELESLIKEDEQ